MEPFRNIQDFEHLKILSDARRLAILRLLMAGPATLSQLGHALGEHPARVRHHLKLLERTGLIELTDLRVARGFVEKYYRARAGAYFLQQLILPAIAAGENSITILGSHDLALEALVRKFQEITPNHTHLYMLPTGSMDGLVGLRQGYAQLAGCHLLDVETGEYNRPYVQHIFPDRQIRMITLAHREQGLLVAEGNPLGIHGLEDLRRPDVTLINRNPGSGTRLWLDRSLHRLGIEPGNVNGYASEARTHTAVAEAILAGQANAGVGQQAAARQHGLDFIPLFEERFDLVAPAIQLEEAQLSPLFDLLASGAFRKEIENLGGYRTGETGNLIPV